jgi:hypothetical protein
LRLSEFSCAPWKVGIDQLPHTGSLEPGLGGLPVPVGLAAQLAPLEHPADRIIGLHSRSAASLGIRNAGLGSALAGAVCFAAFPQREPRQLLGRQILCSLVDSFDRRAVKGDALVVVKHGPAVDR